MNQEIRHCWPTMDRLTEGQRAAVLRAVIDNLGLDADDFRLTSKASSWLNGLLGISDEFMAVTRVSSGRERVYSADARSPWLAELVRDIEAGAFGRLRADP